MITVVISDFKRSHFKENLKSLLNKTYQRFKVFFDEFPQNPAELFGNDKIIVDHLKINPLT